ncbi:MAG TPA: M28 family peptidase [Vicinamibacterales bacterium]|nr:M28 family peptidase [Vicinamibacterales bacterium]
MTKATILFVALAATVAAAPADADFSAERFKAHVTFLADDLLEGREAGTRGHEIAAKYIAAQFELFGLKPGGDDGTYFKKVDLLESALTATAPTLSITTPAGPKAFKHGITAMIGGPLGGGSVRVSGPLVFVGYGMTDKAMGYDDYQGLDVRGKIAVVLLGSPKGMDSEIGAHLLHEQPRFAAEHGAVAVLRIPSRLMSTALPWDKVVQYLGEPVTTWVRKNGTPYDPTYGLKAAAMIEPKAAASLFDGAGITLAQILDEADKEGGRPKGRALKSTAEITVSTKVRRYSSPDVIGVIEGSDGKLKDEYVALMGHADHIGVKRTGKGDRINNGALDNAAGTATLLEVARVLTSTGRPRRSVLIVANTAEEKGLLGAEYFAHYPTVPIEKITAAIDLDMPLITYDFTDVIAYGATHSTLQDAFRQAGGAMNVKLSPDPMPEQAVFVRSDHYAMVKVGVPAVMLATGMENGGSAAWGKYLSDHYHQPSDDMSLPIVWKAGAKFAEVNYRVVRALADADAPAQWYEGDYFGTLFAPKASKAPKPGSLPHP